MLVSLLVIWTERQTPYGIFLSSGTFDLKTYDEIWKLPNPKRQELPNQVVKLNIFAQTFPVPDPCTDPFYFFALLFFLLVMLPISF